MKSDIDRIYLIDRFLKGELSGLTLDEFKSRMRSNSEFALEVESQRAIIEGIKLARKQHLISILNGEKTPGIIAPVKQSFENTEKIIEQVIPNFKEKEQIETKEYKLKPNFNDWYLSVAAVLLAGLLLYFVFGYYIPHQKLEMANIDSTTSAKPEENLATTPESKPDLAVNPSLKDTSKTENDSLEKPLLAQGGDSMKVENDKKLFQTMYSVAAFETITPEESDNNSNVSTGGTGNDLKVNNLRKVKGSTVKVEYWQSVVGFKGYKLSNTKLQLFDMKPEEKVSLKYIDKQLYLKKNGSYYKLNASGNFESYQKENNSELIKSLESN